jgi:DNA-directed RNA polymerase specialized sigma24 family protein
VNASGDDDIVEIPSAGLLPGSQIMLAAMLALQLEGSRSIREQAGLPPPEVLLADLGMSIGQIARVTGRNYETVKSTIRRVRERAARDSAVRKSKKA